MDADIRGVTQIEKIFTVLLILLVGGFVLSQIHPIKRLQMLNDMKRINDLKNIKTSLDLYYKNFGKYPVSSPNYEIIDFKTNTPIDWGFAWDPYIKSLPKDSRADRHYVYYASSDQQSYWLYANLEDPQDSASSCHRGVQCDGIVQNKIRGDACGEGFVCNFGLSSGNVSP